MECPEHEKDATPTNFACLVEKTTYKHAQKSINTKKKQQQQFESKIRVLCASAFFFYQQMPNEKFCSEKNEWCHGILLSNLFVKNRRLLFLFGAISTRLVV